MERRRVTLRLAGGGSIVGGGHICRASSEDGATAAPSGDPDEEVFELVPLPRADRSRKQTPTRPPEPQTLLPHPPHRVASTARLGYRYLVSKAGLADKVFDVHRQWLTLRPRSSGYGRRGKGGDDPVKLYSENQRWFSVPRYYGLERWGMVPPAGDMRTRGEPVAVPFVGELSEMQRAVCDRVVNQFSSADGTPGGIIQCPCGFGKTICAINIFCRMGVACVFTVQREDNMEHTAQEIKSFAPGARVGFIHRDTCDSGEGFDFVIVMIQTVLSRDHHPSTFARFGLWIADEMHHMEARSFSTMRDKIRCRWTLGLSATPRRKDGTTQALFWGFGPIIVRVHRRPGSAMARMIRYNRGDQNVIVYKDGRVGKATMLSRLASDPARTYEIVRVLIEGILNPFPKPIPRKAIVLSDRLKQLEDIRVAFLLYMGRAAEERLSEEAGGPVRCKVDDSVENRWAILATREGDNAALEVASVAFYTGGLSKEKKETAKGCRVILATYGEAEENVNIKTLDTVVMATPRCDVEQASGRGLRAHAGKNSPMMIYFVDPFSVFLDSARAVACYYTRDGYDVRWEDR